MYKNLRQNQHFKNFPKTKFFTLNPILHGLWEIRYHMGGGFTEHPPWAKCFLRQLQWPKMVLNAKFWSLALHRYQKQPSMMKFFAARGRGMKLVIDVAKK